MLYLIEPDMLCETSETFTREYVNDRNALRYAHLHLRGDMFPAGQYVVKAWQHGAFAGFTRHVGYLYKLADSSGHDPRAMPTVPADWPVQPIDHADIPMIDSPRDIAQCGECGRYWDDGVSTSMTPAPSGRCPFEYFHGEA